MQIKLKDVIQLYKIKIGKYKNHEIEANEVLKMMLWDEALKEAKTQNILLKNFKNRVNQGERQGERMA